MAFKTAATPDTGPKPVKSSNETHSEVSSEVEVPYTDYEGQNGKPFTVDHYELSDYWNDLEGGFGEEVATIESYMKSQIERGEIANSQKAIKLELKKIEKLTNMTKEERTTVKLGNIAAYAKFLMEANNIKNKVKKYG